MTLCLLFLYLSLDFFKLDSLEEITKNYLFNLDNYIKFILIH